MTAVNPPAPATARERDAQSPATTIWAERALIGDRWRDCVAIDIVDGRIARVAIDSEPVGVRLGLALPAPPNGHSHAFQRAMAGLAEGRGPGHDSFWTWRDLMYRFLDRITPDQLQAIAAFVQMEMLEAGFGASVEFHYLHHQPDGRPYARLAEMAERIAAAAEISGIGLTLLPVHYQFGGCDGRPLAGGQRRFGNDLDRYARLVDEARGGVAALGPDAIVGTAIHSLRATAPNDIAPVAALAGGRPVHMHLAEQSREVDEVQAALGARPVEWMLDAAALGPQWSLIHCTQMTPGETEALAATGAVAGLCPLTEANLGDGVFDGVRWMTAGGSVSIGSDSNVRISLAEELRQLETSQRLRDHSRAALATDAQSTGRRLLEAAATGGATASGRGAGRLEPGAWADILSLRADHPDIAGLSGDAALDCFVLAGGSEMVEHVWSGGRHLVADGRHIARDSIVAAYRTAATALRSTA